MMLTGPSSKVMAKSPLVTQFMIGCDTRFFRLEPTRLSVSVEFLKGRANAEVEVKKRAQEMSRATSMVGEVVRAREEWATDGSTRKNRATGFETKRIGRDDAPF